MEQEIIPVHQRETRVLIRYNTVNVPGLPTDRARRVAEDFASSRMSRHFSYERDFIHCPPDFDCDTKKYVWILCDFNVRNPLSQEKIPLQCWKVNYDEKQLA